MCDGSVHLISYMIDAEVLRRLGNRMDGLAIDGQAVSDSPVTRQEVSSAMFLRGMIAFVLAAAVLLDSGCSRGLHRSPTAVDQRLLGGGQGHRDVRHRQERHD